MIGDRMKNYLFLGGENSITFNLLNRGMVVLNLLTINLRKPSSFNLLFSFGTCDTLRGPVCETIKNTTHQSINNFRFNYGEDLLR